EAFKKQYREALKDGHLTFRPPIVDLTSPTAEEAPGGIMSLPPPSPHEQARTEIAEPAESLEALPQPPTSRQAAKRYWPIFLLSAVFLVACGYAIASLWKHVYYPTVDLVRTIDFSELACDAEGNKHDVAYLNDDYTVVRNLFQFETYVKVADL